MTPWRAVAALMAVLLMTTACTDQAEPAPRLARAAPGKYVTVAGAGLDPEAPGAIDAPVDLAEGPGRGLLFLGEHGSVYHLGPDGKTSEYASGPGSAGPLGSIKALSMARRADGAVLVAVTGEDERRLVLYELAPGKQAGKIGEFDLKNPKSVHLVRAPDQSILLLKDGDFAEGEGLGNVDVPAKLGKIVAAATDGDRHLVALRQEMVWIRDGKVAERARQRAIIDSSQGAALTPDGRGGAYISNKGSGIDHEHRDGRSGSVLIGRAPSRGTCGSEPRPRGPAGRADLQRLGEAHDLMLVANQLYVADSGCRRILAIGLPTPEFME